MRAQVRILNRPGNTSPKKARFYIRRGLATLADGTIDQPIAIVFVDQVADIAAIQTWRKRDRRVENHDDGIERRYAERRSDLQPVKQLRPISEVGTQNYHRKCKVRDNLWHPPKRFAKAS